MESKTIIDTEVLIKRIRLQSIVIAILSIAILAGLFYYFFGLSKFTTIPKTETVRFIKEVPDDTAVMATENFEKVVNFTSISNCKGVLFDSAEIRNYLDKIYPEVIKRHQTIIGSTEPPAGYKWKIAFCWMVRQDETTKEDKLGFYTIPMLTDGKKVVLSYFNVANNKYYNHPKEGESKNIHDEGQLWP